jgi:hypothetical protein
LITNKVSASQSEKCPRFGSKPPIEPEAKQGAADAGYEIQVEKYYEQTRHLIEKKESGFGNPSTN